MMRPEPDPNDVAQGKTAALHALPGEVFFKMDLFGILDVLFFASLGISDLNLMLLIASDSQLQYKLVIVTSDKVKN